MEIEMISVERLPDQQNCSGQSSMISQPSVRQNVASSRRIQQKRSKIAQPKRWFNSCIKSNKMRFFVAALFTSIAITVGVLIVCLTTPKPSPTCQRPFQRTMKSSLVSSSQPQSVAAAHLNNDHHMDIVVANTGTNTIGIFLSTGEDTFAKQQTYSTGSESRPYSIVVSGFNNDTNLDIVVANYGTNNIGLFLGNGNGTFAGQKTFSLGSSQPLFVTVGDFNKDSRMDIVVANDGTNTIGILLGYGNGSFQDQKTCFTGYDSLPYSLVVGDFNNDTELDIAVANYGTNNIGILLGYGNGTFANQQTYTTLPKSNPTSIAVGDLNNDTRLDIAVSNYGTGNIGIFLGHGDGTFVAQTIYSLSSNSHPQYITVGDLNSDNKLDIVIVDSTNDQVHILPGYGNGSFATISTYDTMPDSRPFCIAVADFNNNNQSDIVVVNHGTNNILVLIDYFTKPSARKTTYYHGTPSTVTSVAVSDFNSDHILDVVFWGSNKIHILLGLGNGTFGKEPYYPTADNIRSQYVCVGDLNNDNRTDIIGANKQSDSVGILLGHGDGTFATMTTYSTGNNSQPQWIALGDFNHDHQLDIVSANIGSKTVGILLGHGNGTFATVVIYSTVNNSAPDSVAVGDINNDTHLDLVVTDDGGVVTIFLGLGNGSFIIRNTYSTNSGTFLFSVVLAHFNSDNYLDIAVADTLADNVGVFLGYGNGTFADETIYYTGLNSNPYYVIVADFNNDNLADIVAPNTGTDEVVIFYGDGNGSFALAGNYSTGLGTKPYGIVAADFDNNKQLEMVVALFGTGEIAVLTEYQAAKFVSEPNYSTGSAPQPFSLAVGDFNHDNRSDVVVANSGTDNLDILLGIGNGSFSMKMTYPIGTDSYPQYVLTCDINNDTNLDIVSVNSKNNSISVIMGYGNGTFAEQLIYSTGDNSHPYAVASIDSNNDGRLDLVIANEGTDSIGIFIGFNYTSFQSQVTYASDDSLNPSGIIVHDFNHDSFLDIITTFYWSDTIGILSGYGNGSFSTITTYSTGRNSGPLGIAADDFNNDNQLDIVVTNWYSNSIGVLLGDGKGSFAAIMTYSTGDGSSPIAVAVNDLNNDGRMDIVVANSDTDNVGVLLGYGNGSFSTIQTYSTKKGSSPCSLTINDFNNDHRLDIAVANCDTNCVGILRGYGDGTFTDQITFPTGGVYSKPYSITTGDFNNDYQLDIATADWNDNGVGILLGYGNGSFADMMFYSSGDGSLPYYISVGDFNHDNISDIAVANSGTNNIVVLFGFGDGTFLLGTPYSTGINSQPLALAMGDFNNDSRLDIAVANNAANNTGVFLNYDSQPFAGVTTYSTGDGSHPHSVAVGDLSNDGWSDIVVANYGTDNVGVLLGYGDGTFDSIVTNLTGKGSAPYCVAVADLNNDQRLDIVVTSSGIDSIIILFGDGSGTFGRNMTCSTGPHSRPYTVIVGDFNNDNTSDLAIANSGTSNIFLLYGLGNGTFGNETTYPLGYGYHPYSIAVADLNQDNWMDIVIACYDTDHIETLIQIC